jgi:hypothetical protein
MATASLLAYILVSKFDDHLPLYRLNEILARMGADIPESTLVDWCGRTMKLLLPLTERIDAHALAHDLLHADDTPIRVLDRNLRTAGVSGNWARASARDASGLMFSTRALGPGRPHRVSPTNKPILLTS